MVKNSSDAEDFRFFLKEFPSGINADKAKIRLEELVWQSIKNSTDKTKVQAYLNDFPNGANASAARIKLRQLEAANTTTTTTDNSSTAVTRGTIRKNSIGMELVYIPAGEFMMGSSSSDITKAQNISKSLYGSEIVSHEFMDETPQRKIKIKEGFWMGKYEITQEQWEKVMGITLRQHIEKKAIGIYKQDDGSTIRMRAGSTHFGDGKEYPIYYVSWEDAKEFIKKLNEMNNEFVYSLPTESQWEYAVRAGTTTLYYWGDDIKNILMCSYANVADQTARGNLKDDGYAPCQDGYVFIAPVGSYKPNNFGLYDMNGNVSEWCEDMHKSTYESLPTDGSANVSQGEEQYLRINRGGSWAGDNTLRSADRGWQSKEERFEYIGFRIVARFK